MSSIEMDEFQERLFSNQDLKTVIIDDTLVHYSKLPLSGLKLIAHPFITRCCYEFISLPEIATGDLSDALVLLDFINEYFSYSEEMNLDGSKEFILSFNFEVAYCKNNVF